MKPVLLAGATGLVGQAVLAAHDPEKLQITTVGRRKTGQLSREIVADFQTVMDLPGAEVAVCALGTTIARAGSRDAFRSVDYDAVLRFAEAAQTAGVTHFIVVSAVGANSKAAVFYARVKGEVERELESLGFKRLDILQPGLLLGDRQESRPVETFLRRTDPLTRLFLQGPLDRYAGITVEVMAGAIIALCEAPEAGVYRHENRALHQLAGS
ncbi:oxidoreductase [Congregibacter litoralis]|uniref:NADH(P)-binding protein n=1 Tax=Congregibacter litoralis KT71 TaxID=314285 RepID=A4A745_9GAMM|nr:oxidoreductase [Congregibacter litoralis]EAQ98114.1 NADH(P)-binding protein [Congregibacter litoralis KT71]